jgi:tetratricopeptide (TPR) repeat protein
VPATGAPPKVAKRSFLERINPLNLFRSSDDRPVKPTELRPVAHSPQNEPARPGEVNEKLHRPRPGTAEPDSVDTNLQAPPPSGSPGHYAYKSPPPPSSGNEEDAERAFEQGWHAYQTHRLPEAMQAYRLAIQADPSLFEAHYNLGLVATEVGNLTLALTSYENALAIEPKSPEARLKSIDARYNFALVLKQANFPADAARELEKLLAAYPNETRAHLALANLYAQQLSKPAKAREQYLKVLEAEPQCSAATAIRCWLRDHPA